MQKVAEKFHFYRTGRYREIQMFFQQNYSSVYKALYTKQGMVSDRTLGAIDLHNMFWSMFGSASGFLFHRNMVFHLSYRKILQMQNVEAGNPASSEQDGQYCGEIGMNHLIQYNLKWTYFNGNDYYDVNSVGSK